jgi:hypothetical protein
MGYGSRALNALNSFYSGEYFNLDEASRPEPSYPDAAAIDKVGPQILLAALSKLIAAYYSHQTY